MRAFVSLLVRADRATRCRAGRGSPRCSTWSGRSREPAPRGIVPSDAAAAIDVACAPETFDWDALLAEGRRSGNPAEPLVRALARGRGRPRALGAPRRHEPGRDRHRRDAGQPGGARASCSGTSTATPRPARAPRAHRDTPMAGRTLLQHAVPTTFGLKAAGWLCGLLDARARLRDLRGGLTAQLGGAAGTLSALGRRARARRRFGRELDLREPTLPWHANRVRIAELGAALEIASGVGGKIALDLGLLAQTEVGEVERARGDRRRRCRTSRIRWRRSWPGPAPRRGQRTQRVLGRPRARARTRRRCVAGRMGRALGRARDGRRRGRGACRGTGGARGRRRSDAGESRREGRGSSPSGSRSSSRNDLAVRRRARSSGGVAHAAASGSSLGDELAGMDSLTRGAGGRARPRRYLGAAGARRPGARRHDAEEGA